jgi:hypothetical protein
MDNGMTPLNRIMPQQASSSGMDDGDALVAEILSDVNQLHSTPGQSQPQPQMMRRQPQPQPQMNYEDDEEDYAELPPPPPRRRPKQSTGSGSAVSYPEPPPAKDEDDFFKLILDNAKLPLIVGLLVLLMGMTYADDTLGKFIPSLLTPAGNLGFGGLVAKSITAGLLFYVLQRLLS